ncbi:transcriptional regulator [Pseudomonas putida]|uniref:Transcriptional regulator n=1 Tax=Pseudomonas putida TaxID=303 RepID=A0A1L7NJT5_PSEPU|nr:transcriptional regulator [Pseudomonas putida]
MIQSFGISRQQASKDINTYITEHAPKNLTYDKQLKGYMPSKQFKPLLIDDSASARPTVVVMLDSSEKR